jgi:putative salt-induced outer membrane protein YdiY
MIVRFQTRICVLTLLLALAAGPARSQEAPTIADEAPDRWRVALELGYNGSTGNTRLMVLTTGFRIKHLQTELLELEWQGALRYGESEGDVVARSIRTSFTADYRPQERWSPFVFMQAERDRFRRLDARTSLGTGVKHTFTRNEQRELSLSAAVLHHHENFSEPQGAGALDSRTEARWSVRWRGFRQIGTVVRVDNTTFFKPVWNDSGDYDLDSSTALAVRLSERVGLKFSHTFRRDATPPPGVEHNDQLVQAGITVEF